MNKQLKFAILGATLWGNRGAEAMLVTTIGEVHKRFPDANIVIFSYLPQEDRALIQDKSIQIFSARPWALVMLHFAFAWICWLFRLSGILFPKALLPASVDCLRNCDAVLDISGISFADGREKFLPFNIMIVWPALLLKIPVIKLSQAMGPFRHPLNRLSTNLFLRSCRYVYARGATTDQFMQEINFDPHRYSVAADIAFLYQPEYSLTQENDDKIDILLDNLKSIAADDSKQLIGLVPSSVVWEKSEKRGQDYLGGFLRLITDLGTEYHFVLLPNATREGSDTHRNNDIFVIDLLKQRAQSSLDGNLFAKLHWIDFDINTARSRDIIVQCDAIVTSRFHAMISGLALAVPTAVIGWSHKYTEVMAEFGVDEFAVDFSKPELAHQMIKKLIDEKIDVKTKLVSRLTPIKASSKKQFDDLEMLFT